ncbi:hypothetical protein AB0D42_26215 [Streptomyces sp. NPDC048304]|uniref:hypothetical protein n=1 Tax=Streptomyces sp. NPDC048304 TaxID=3154820 RepID=UPI00340441DA
MRRSLIPTPAQGGDPHGHTDTPSSPCTSRRRFDLRATALFFALLAMIFCVLAFLVVRTAASEEAAETASDDLRDTAVVEAGWRHRPAARQNTSVPQSRPSLTAAWPTTPTSIPTTSGEP